MASFWSRKNKQKGGPPLPPASGAADLGVLLQKNGAKSFVEGAGPRQPDLGGLEEKVGDLLGLQHPKKGSRLSRAIRALCHLGWLKDRREQHPGVSRGAEESWRTSRRRQRVAKGRAELQGGALGRPGETGTSQEATRGAGGQQREQVDSVTAGSIQSVVLSPTEPGQDELIPGRQARPGHVPRGGGGPRDEGGGTRPLVGVEEGRTPPKSLGLEDEGGPEKNCNALGGPGEEQRRQVVDKLQRLGEDVARWERRSTKDLAARLVELILQTDTRRYPTEMGGGPEQQEQGQRGAGAVVGTQTDVTTAELREPDVVQEDTWHLSDVPEEIWEDSDDELLEEEGPPDVPRPVVQLMVVTVGSKERWREEFPEVWAQHEMDCGLVAGEVEVSRGPVTFQEQPSLPANVEDTLARLLEVLLATGVVVRGRSPFNSPVMLIPKQNGTAWRLMLNCRAMKGVTTSPAATGRVDLGRMRLLTSLSPQSCYFSTVDLSDASYAIPLAVGSRARFAFTFRRQQYLFTRLPVGFHGTTSILHQRVGLLLSRLPQEDQPWVFHYVDDILIAGRSHEDTQARTRRVLTSIREEGFKAKLEKAQLVQPKVDYLGMTLGPEGREIQAAKKKVVGKLRAPRDPRGVRSLLGRLGHHRDHVPQFWELALPLQHLVAQGDGGIWGVQQERALGRLKNAILAAPPLRFPDRSQPFVVRMGTGEETVGATLLQDEGGGRLVPVLHSSRLLRGHQVLCKPEEKSCLAAVWALQDFQAFTGPAPILIQLPHAPRRYLLRGVAPERWTLLLVNGGEAPRGPQPGWGDPRILPVPSAPPLEQLPSHVPRGNVWFLGCWGLGFAAASLEERWLLGVATGDSVLSTQLAALWHLLCQHRRSSPLYLYTSCWALLERLENWDGNWEEPGASSWPSVLQWLRSNPGVLQVRALGEGPREMEWNQKVATRASVVSATATGNRHFWEPSKQERQEIVARCHSYLHEEEEGTLARVRLVAGWEGDREEVARWVQNCLQCAMGKRGAARVLPQRGEGLWARLQLGYVSNLPQSEEGPHSLLVVEDEFSGWVEAFPVDGEVEEVAEVLSRGVFARYGTPRAICVPPFLRDVLAMVPPGGDPPWAILQQDQEGWATTTLRLLAQGAGKDWLKMLPLLLAGMRAVRARGAALSPALVVPDFPLEMRWGYEAEGCPPDNVLAWLGGLQEEGGGYKPRMEAALPRC